MPLLSTLFVIWWTYFFYDGSLSGSPAFILPIGAYALGIFFFTWGWAYLSFSRAGLKKITFKLHETLHAVPLFLLFSIFCFSLCLWRTTDLGESWLLEFWSIVLIALALIELWRASGFLYDHAREQAEAASFAQTEASEARLAALRAQMNPHFLFNALNTVAAQVQSSPENAEATVENLAQVLRRTLKHNEASFCRLEDEIDYLKAYLGVEKARMKHKLRIHWNIEATLFNQQIPTMSLQPLVENAIKHGIGRKIEGGDIIIEAKDLTNHIILSVQDNGFGFVEKHKEGVGLKNLRQRLKTLYNQDAHLIICSLDPGASVAIQLPKPKEDK